MQKIIPRSFSSITFVALKSVFQDIRNLVFMFLQFYCGNVVTRAMLKKKFQIYFLTKFMDLIRDFANPIQKH